MADQRKFDVAISGGGMIGLTLGIALARNGFHAVVVDMLAPSAVTDAKFDGRVSAVAFGSCRMLKVLGLWDVLAPDAQPINDILVTDGTVRGGASAAFLHFDHREIGEEPLGHLIENRHIRAALFDAAAGLANLTLIAPMSVAGANANDAHSVVKLSNGDELQASLVIAAEGRNSRLRDGAGLKLIQWEYDQTGIVTTVEHAEPHQGIAQEFFLPSGPFAILPMTGNRSSLVWTEKTEAAKALLSLPEGPFADEMRARFGTHLGEAKPVGPRWSYPLSLQLARSYIAERLALVGDTAHGIHPIAGQGLNLGFRDVAALSEILVETARLGLDIGAPSALEKYQRWRRFDNFTLAAATDVLNRLFSNDDAVLRRTRDAGLAVVNRIAPARAAFMRHAGGIFGLTSDSLPRMLRGEAL